MAENANKAEDEIYRVDPRQGARIRFGSRDEEAGAGPSMARIARTTTSTSQLSIASSRRRRYSIDPSTALPITYRTVSFAIEETKEKPRIEAARVKQDAAAELGDL